MRTQSQTNNLLLLLGIFLVIYTFQSPIKSAYIFVTTPISAVGQFFAFGLNSNISFLFNAGNFQRENDTLRLKISELQGKVAACQETTRENSNLRDAIKLHIESKLNLISAKTISKSPQTDSLIINRGEIQGVLPGMAVITAQNILVGRVAKTYTTYSEVDMLSNTALPIFNAKVATSGLEVLVKGAGNGLMKLEFAPSDKDLQEGDILVSTLTGGVFPEGMLIGKISMFKKNDTDAVPQVEVRSDYKFTGSDYIYLVAPK